MSARAWKQRNRNKGIRIAYRQGARIAGVSRRPPFKTAQQAIEYVVRVVGSARVQRIMHEAGWDV